MRREYKGGAQPSVLTIGLSASTADLTIYCNDLTNWPTGVSGRPFYIVIDRGKSNEEKILCSSRSGNTLTVYNSGLANGRAADGTPLSAHTINAVVEHVFTATDADEANAHVNASGSVHGIIGQFVGATDVQTLTNKTLTSPTITSPTISTPTITNGTISGATVSAPTITTTGAQASTARVRQTILSTGTPTSGDGTDGDVWLRYV